MDDFESIRALCFLSKLLTVILLADSSTVYPDINVESSTQDLRVSGENLWYDGAARDAFRRLLTELILAFHALRDRGLFIVQFALLRSCGGLGSSYLFDRWGVDEESILSFKTRSGLGLSCLGSKVWMTQ